MTIQTYNELKEMLCRELEEITRKKELTAGSLDTVDKLTHSIKSIETIIAMNEAEEGQSNSYPYTARSYAYGGGMSNRRGQRRDSMGRYSRENRGYSREDARADMVSDLYALMQDAPDEPTRRKLQRFISEIESA